MFTRRKRPPVIYGDVNLVNCGDQDDRQRLQLPLLLPQQPRRRSACHDEQSRQPDDRSWYELHDDLHDDWDGGASDYYDCSHCCRCLIPTCCCCCCCCCCCY